jgi:hypothetical protein
MRFASDRMAHPGDLAMLDRRLADCLRAGLLR